MISFRQSLSHIIFMSVLFSGLFAHKSSAAPSKSRRVAVLEFKNDAKLKTDEIRFLADLFRRKALTLNKYGLVVMTRENILELMEPGKALEQCEGACEVETGRLLGASYLVSGQVLRIEGTLKLVANLYDTKSGALISSIQHSGPTVTALERSIMSSEGPELFSPLRKNVGLIKDRAFDQSESWDLRSQEDSEIVEFKTDPPGATLEVDGNPICETPCSKQLAIGSHAVGFKKVRYLPIQEDLEVRRGMKPISKSLTPNFGYLSAQTVPSGLPLTLDGKTVLPLPVQDYWIDPGPHRIEIASDIYYKKGMDFSISPSERREILLKPEPKLGAISITVKSDKGDDLKSNIYIDGNLDGQSPLRKKLQIGKHRVYASYEGTETDEEVVSIGEKQESTLTLKMTDDSLLKSRAERTQIKNIRNFSYGVSIAAFAASWYFQKQANSNYEKYKQAKSADEAEKMRDEVKSNDDNAAAAIAIGAASGGFGLYLSWKL